MVNFTSLYTVNNLDGDIAVYRDAQGSPTIYFSEYFTRPAFCTYDDAGDLFIDEGFGNIGEMPSGGNSFAQIYLNYNISPQSLQWLNGALVTPGGTYGDHGSERIFQVAVSGSSGTVTEIARLHNHGDTNPERYFADWIQGRTIVGPDESNGFQDVINFWHYPRGGHPIKTLKAPYSRYDADISSVVVSP